MTMTDQALEQRRRVAAALRDLAREITTAATDDRDFAATAEVLERIREELACLPRIRFEVDGLHTRDHAAKRSGLEPAYDRDPLIGLSNPLAPPLLRRSSDTNEWEVHFGAAYGGHPGIVHGGYVAAVLDHVLGVAASSSGFAVMTGSLTTHFRRPTPLDTQLVCVGRVDRVAGRKVYCSAALTAGDTLVAEAEGLYVRVDPDRY